MTALPGFVPPSLTAGLVALVLSAAMMCGCDHGTASGSRRPRDVSDLITHVSLGKTTAADVEQQFGTADDRLPDGSLVYRLPSTRGGGERAATEVETVTLRFAGGVMNKICRSRS